MASKTKTKKAVKKVVKHVVKKEKAAPANAAVNTGVAPSITPIPVASAPVTETPVQQVGAATTVASQAKMTNKFTKWAMGWSAGALAAVFLVPILDLILAIVGLCLGIKGYRNYKKDSTIGGKSGAIVSIVVSIIVLVISIFQLIGMIVGPLPLYY